MGKNRIYTVCPQIQYDFKIRFKKAQKAVVVSIH